MLREYYLMITYYQENIHEYFKDEILDEKLI